MDRLFDPFFTTRKSDKGTGLGLTVVHEVVKNAGGSILIHSEVGKGTSFDVFFPLILDPLNQFQASSTLVSGEGDKHILLVDDNTADLRSIHQLLVHFGYFVTSTTDPHEALSIFREEPKKFDLLITDQVMPRMRGHELATHVHKIRKDLPVIICSGSEEAIRELQKHQVDIHDYIHKPFSKDQLMDAMQRALN
jgi:CheY-like chemotaxis protein